MQKNSLFLVKNSIDFYFLTVFLRAVICCRVTAASLFTKNIRSFFALNFVASGLFGIKFYPKFRKNVFATSIFRMQFRSGFRVGFCAVRMAFLLAVNLRIAA